MIQIRFHGRGGQGAVLSADMLALALFKEGKYSQSSPFFGEERRGAPVRAFLRVDDKSILTRGEIFDPDHICVFDPALIKDRSILSGLKKGGWIVVNSAPKSDVFKSLQEFRIAACDANSIAAKYNLGPPQARIVNTAVLGALDRVLDLVKLETLLETITELAPVKKKENAAAACEAYETVKIWDYIQ